MAYYEGCVNDLTTGGNNGNSGFGNGEGAWWIIIFLIFALGGWNGNNGYGRDGGGSGAANNYVLTSDFATLQRQLSDGFQSTTAGINQVNNGLCNGFYENAQLINGVQQTLCQGFSGVTNAIGNNGYETRLAVQNLSSQLSGCCCDIREGISGVNYNMAMNNNALQATLCNNTRDIIDSQTNGTRAILDAITANRMEDKNAQIAALTQRINTLELSESQANQTNYITNTIIDRLSPCPRPAYITCNPNTSIPVQYVATSDCRYNTQQCGC